MEHYCSNCSRKMGGRINYCTFCGYRMMFDDGVVESGCLRLWGRLLKYLLCLFGGRYLICPKCSVFCRPADTFCYECGSLLKPINVVEREKK